MNTTARLILLGAPNTIKEDIINHKLDEKHETVDQKLTSAGEQQVQDFKKPKVQVAQLYSSTRISGRNAMGACREEGAEKRHI
jgi:hypothetical protein